MGKSWDWHEKELQNFIKTQVVSGARERTLRIYVDALDECGQDIAKDLINFFQQVMSEAKSHNTFLSICFSCRHYPNIALESGFEVCVEDENHQDIKRYIQEKMDRPMLETTNPKIIQEAITDRSGGSFQWTSLVVSRVLDLHARGKSRTYILNFIQKIPSELHELYKDLLSGIEAEDLAQSIRLMQWIYFAMRPLSLDELRFAMAIDENVPYASIQECQDGEEYVESHHKMTKRVLDLSRGLAEVRSHEGKQIVQFIHQSVNDFLLEGGFARLSDNSGNIISHAHFRLSRTCLRYIAMEEIRSLKGAQRWEQPLGRCFVPKGDREELDNDFPFLSYATLYWTDHARGVEKYTPQDDLLFYCYHPSNSILPIWTELFGYFNNWSKNFPIQETALLHIVCRYDWRGLLTYMLKFADLETNCKDECGRTPLSYAIEGGHETIVRLLINRDDVEVNIEDEDGQALLSCAAQYGHEAIVRLLIGRDEVMVDTEDEGGRTPLSYAAEAGHEAIVRLLIERDGVDLDHTDIHGWTPLSYATMHVHEMIVRLLKAAIEARRQQNTSQQRMVLIKLHQTTDTTSAAAIIPSREDFHSKFSPSMNSPGKGEREKQDGE